MFSEAALVDSGLQALWLKTRSFFTRSPQYAATFLVAASLMFTFQASPSVPYHLAPACWARPAQVAASSPQKEVMRASGSAFLISSAAVLNSAQVLGTAILCCSKRSLR